MKKILICLVTLVAVSCEVFTKNYTTKHLGGVMTINVETGYKVTSATFKEDEVWYFVEKMDDTYVPT